MFVKEDAGFRSVRRRTNEPSTSTSNQHSGRKVSINSTRDTTTSSTGSTTSVKIRQGRFRPRSWMRQRVSCAPPRMVAVMLAAVTAQLILFQHANVEASSDVASAAVVLRPILSNDTFNGLFARYTEASEFDGVLVSAHRQGQVGPLADGCDASHYAHAPSDAPWVALALRSNCSFGIKTLAATKAGAQGVLIANNLEGGNLLTLSGDIPSDIKKPSPTISLTRESGFFLWNLTQHAEPGPWVHAKVTSEPEPPFYNWTSALVNNAVFFFGAMMVTIAMTLFVLGTKAACMYQNDRQTNQQRTERVQSVLDSIPTREYNTREDKTEDGDSSHDQCAVCLQNYEDGDVVRELHCEHLFHTACVDPWLLDHTTCPLCKRSMLSQEDIV